MRRRTKTLEAPAGAGYEIRVLGDRSTLLRDFYHHLLQSPWWITIVAISGCFLIANTIFALAYLVVGGIAHAGRWSFGDAFFFSVQTMGTVGYGALFPQSTAANVVMVAESITSLTLTALATGLMFAKFSRSTARIVFTHQASIAPMDGVPTLMFRVGNERGNQIVDAQIRVVMVRTERTAEGKTFYRWLDLNMLRGRALSLSRSWTVFHPIDRASPLYSETPESMLTKEIELHVLVVGLDNITMQTVHAGHQYFAHQIVWGARHADILSDIDSTHMVVDLRRFHDLEPSAPTPDFPYPSAGAP